MNKFWTVVSHTYTSKIKARSFIISTLIMVIVLGVIVNFDKITSAFSDSDHKKIAVIDNSNENIYSALKQQVDSTSNKVSLSSFEGSEAAAKKAVANDEYEGYLIISTQADGSLAGTYKASKITDNDTIKAIQQSLQQVKVMQATQQLGLSSDQVADVFTPVSFEKVALDKHAKTEKEINQASGLVYVVNLIIYISILSFGTMIAMEIATEKASRVMEIIISSVSPVTQMLGKIIGIALLGITQYIVIFGVTYGVASVFGKSSSADSIVGYVKNVPISLMLYAILFFLIGYFLFSTLFATIGSLVSRVEDINQAVAPITFLAVATFLVSVFGLNSPESPVITVMSFVPFFTPIVMFLRVGILDIPLWQVVTGIVINVAVIFLLIFIGMRVYKGGVLMYGTNSVWRSLKGAIRLTKEN